MDVSLWLHEALRLAGEPLPATVVWGWAGLGLLVVALFWIERTPLGVVFRTGAFLVVVALLAVPVVAVTTRGESGPEYYKHVDEVVADRDFLLGERLQVHGCVVGGSIERDVDDPSRYRFALGANGRTIDATYQGLVPDTFVDGNEVVVKARLRRDGVLDVVPDGIMAKCGSHLPPPDACSYRAARGGRGDPPRVPD